MTVQVILSHATHLYLDMKHEPDPEEPGLYWASRETPLKKVFSYRPDSIYDNVDVDLDGRTLDRRKLCTEFACPPLTAPDNIIGTIVHHTTFQSVMSNVDAVHSHSSGRVALRSMVATVGGVQGVQDVLTAVVQSIKL